MWLIQPRLIPVSLTLSPLRVISTNFSLQYHPRITNLGYENKGNDHQLKKLLIVKEIHLVSPLRNV